MEEVFFSFLVNSTRIFLVESLETHFVLIHHRYPKLTSGYNVYEAFQLREFYSIKTEAWEIVNSSYNF